MQTCFTGRRELYYRPHRQGCVAEWLRKARIYVAALAAVLVFVFSSDLPLWPANWWKAAATAVSITAVVDLLWDHLLWKLSLVVRLTGRPNVAGTWKGRLSSQYHTNWGQSAESACELRTAEIDVYLVVRQRFGAIRIHQYTKSSAGETHFAAYNGDGSRAEAVTVYRNDPKPGEAMAPHRGTTHYVFQADGKRITADYWTSRFTRGTVVFDEWRPKKASSFEEAIALFR